MSIEKQVRDGIADFRALVVEGWDLGAAILEAATSNGLKPDAFKQRLEKTMILEAWITEIRSEAAKEHTRETIHKAVEQYICEGINWFKRAPAIRAGMLESVEKALGRTPSSEEEAQVDRSYSDIRADIQQRHHQRQLKILRQIGSEDGVNAQN